MCVSAERISRDGSGRRTDGTQGLKPPDWFPDPGPHLPLARPAGRRWWLGRESRVASTRRAPPTPGRPSFSRHGSGTRRSSGQEGWVAGGPGVEEAGGGAPSAPPLHRGRRSSSQPGASQQVWARTHHCGEPHRGVYEELEGLGRSLLDSPKSHRHAGGTQDYEGEPKYLGKQAGIRLVGERKMATFLPVPANWTGTPRPTGQWPRVGHCNVPA